MKIVLRNIFLRRNIWQVLLPNLKSVFRLFQSNSKQTHILIVLLEELLRNIDQVRASKLNEKGTCMRLQDWSASFSKNRLVRQISRSLMRRVCSRPVVDGIYGPTEKSPEDGRVIMICSRVLQEIKTCTKPTT